MSSKNSILPFLVVLLASSCVVAQQNDLAWSNVDSTQLWGCGGSDPRYDLPIQVLNIIMADGYHVKSLNITNGNYEQLLSIGKHARCAVGNGFQINSCAMSGSENKEALYCVYTNGFKDQSCSTTKTRQLMRISKGLNGEAYETCVGELDFPFNANSNAATFDAARQDIENARPRRNRQHQRRSKIKAQYLKIRHRLISALHDAVIIVAMIKEGYQYSTYGFKRPYTHRSPRTPPSGT